MQLPIGAITMRIFLLSLAACCSTWSALGAWAWLLGVSGLFSPQAWAASEVYYKSVGSLYRIEAAVGAVPQRIEIPGVNVVGGAVAPNGGWLVFRATETGCDDCLAISPFPFQTYEILKREDGSPVAQYPGSVAAVAATGEVVVFEGAASHAADILVTRRAGGGWSEPVSLSSDSPHPFNNWPVISLDGSKVVFDCGTDPYAQSGGGICEVGLDGGGFRERVAVARFTGFTSFLQPALGLDGTLYFEGDSPVEQIWAVAPGQSSPTLPAPSFTNDNSPCVLPNGNIVSLWLGREGSAGHELRLMAPGGEDLGMILPGVDVDDVGITCADSEVSPFPSLSVSLAGGGKGRVVSAPRGIRCGSVCRKAFKAGRVVRLRAVPAKESRFAGWGGACSGAGTCVVTLSEDVAVEATFVAKKYALRVRVSGTGVVTDASDAVQCDTACEQEFDSGTRLMLAAQPADGASFVRWKGACKGTRPSCNVTVNKRKAVTAVFAGGASGEAAID